MTISQLDQHTIDQARELLALKDGDAVKAHTGQDDAAMAYSGAFGAAQYVMAELVALVERMAEVPR